MKRLAKILLWSSIGLLSFFLLIIVIITLLFNPNDYKPQITQLVQEKIGRTLTINGEIRLSFFPWLGIELGQTTLGNADGFEEPDFVRFKSAAVRVKLLPLLTQQIEIDKIFIDHLQIALTRHTDGKTNWDDLMALTIGQENSAASTSKKEFNINGIEVNHAHINWDDQLTKNHYELSETYLRTDQLSLYQAFNAELTAKLMSYGENPIQGTFAAKGVITLTPTQQKINQLQTQITLQGNSILAGKQPLILQAKIEADIDLIQSQLILAINSLKVQNLTGTGSINANLNQITGQLNFAHFSPTLLTQDFNLPAIKLLNGKTFSQGNCSAYFDIDPQRSAKIENLKISLDDNQFFIPVTIIDLLNQTVSIEKFSLKGFGTDIQGKVTIKNILQQPILQASISAINSNISQLSPLLGTDFSSFPSALIQQKLTLNSELNSDLNTLNINKLKLKIGENQFDLANITIDLLKKTFAIPDFSVAIQAKLIEQWVKIPKAVSFDQLYLTTQLQGNSNEFEINQLQAQAGSSRFVADKINFNMEKQLVNTHLLTMNSLDLQLKVADLQINDLLTQPQWSGAVNLKPFNLRKLLEKLELAALIPVTTDIHVLEKIGLSTKIVGNLSKIQLTETTLQLDNSKLTGYLQVNQFKQPEITFSFDIDRLDIDPYLPPKTEDSKESKPIDLPIEMIRKLNINGQLNINWLKVANVKMEAVQVKVTAKDGILQFHPFNALLYNGIHEGNVALDVKNTPARLYIVATLTGIQTELLLTDFMKKSPIVGTANVSAQLAADPTSIVSTLFGSVSLNLVNGNLANVNIGRTIRELQALLKNQSLPTETEPLQTDFSTFSGLFLADQGIIHNENLTIKSPLLRIQGKGDFILKNQDINYNLAVAIVESSMGQGGKELDELRGITIPLKVTGQLNQLKLQVKPDFLQNLLFEYSKAQAAIKLEQTKEKLLKKHENELGGVLSDYLKNLSVDDFLK